MKKRAVKRTRKPASTAVLEARIAVLEDALARAIAMVLDHEAELEIACEAHGRVIEALDAEHSATKLIDGARVAIKSASGQYLSRGQSAPIMGVSAVPKIYGDGEIFTLELQP